MMALQQFSNIPGSLKEQSVGWFRAKSEELVRTYAEALSISGIDLYEAMTYEELLNTGKLRVEGLLHRFERNEAYPQELMVDIFRERLQQGVRLSELVKIIDLFTALLVEKVNNDLKEQSQLHEYLISRIGYEQQLVKSSAAAAAISLQNIPQSN